MNRCPNSLQNKLSITACRVLIFVVVFFLFSLSQVNADSLYQWTDHEGHVHYSNTPVTGNSKPLSLPPLQRESIDQRIQNIRQATPTVCDNHGGVDCQKGADTDGSVVCADGFRDTVLEFREQCSETKLQIEFAEIAFDNGTTIPLRKFKMPEVSPPISPGQDPKMSAPKPDHIQVSIRNLGGIAAAEIRVELEYAPEAAVVLRRDRRRILLDGPGFVEAFGAGDFAVSLEQVRLALVGTRFDMTRLSKLKLTATCSNCTGMATLNH